jgi:hypothetical protein
MSVVSPLLPFVGLDQRHSGVTKAIAESYAEAARVCFDRHHSSPIDFQLESISTKLSVAVRWVLTDAQTKAAWANDTDTTEAGAYACALAAAEVSEGLFAIRRAETKTGADYYVAPQGSPIDDLENSLRLEISGVDGAPAPVVLQRLQAKLKQVARGNGNLPALAGVVGFAARLILLDKVP